MLGSTVLVPFLLVPAMGGTPEDLAQVIQTTFFTSGICTLLQTTVGDRLPIVQVETPSHCFHLASVLLHAERKSASHTTAFD